MIRSILENFEKIATFHTRHTHTRFNSRESSDEVIFFNCAFQLVGERAILFFFFFPRGEKKGDVGRDARQAMQNSRERYIVA